MLVRRYLLTTWCLDNLLHPLLYNLWYWCLGTPVLFSSGFGAMLLGIGFSLPPLYLCYLFFGRFIKMEAKPEVKLACWITFVVFAILASSFLLAVLLGVSPSDILWLCELLVPGCISALLALLLTGKQFYRFAKNIVVYAP